MPTVGVYLNNNTYMKLVQKHGNGIGKHLSRLADLDVNGSVKAEPKPVVKDRIIDGKTGEIIKSELDVSKVKPGQVIPVADPNEPTQEEIDAMTGGL
jgi:hypothetical protein